MNNLCEVSWRNIERMPISFPVDRKIARSIFFFAFFSISSFCRENRLNRLPPLLSTYSFTSHRFTGLSIVSRIFLWDLCMKSGRRTQCSNLFFRNHFLSLSVISFMFHSKKFFLKKNYYKYILQNIFMERRWKQKDNFILKKEIFHFIIQYHARRLID